MSNFNHIVNISMNFYYEYFKNQATLSKSVPGPKFKRDQDRDQSSGPVMTGTGNGTKRWDQK